MSSTLKGALCAFVVTLALGTISSAVAQTAPAPAQSSVLPTGGGQALIDTSDTVLLLLDHQRLLGGQETQSAGVSKVKRIV